ncbi:uncharacterized protein I206_100018 [Kwoniella pini CBS 10737]|uniref:Uncharacterized protein n=1 Tax=Kwoniella pini CBS 10737 TaxID=1296096 RepID=A0A1B9HSA7_9TREE|nr:uncharacterized protein I206_07833 [Kwoniella pini CBS 10737]OCF46163.1 hypothetical protein I206_07833 [Kwoniella pini CBS 10737]
MSAVPKYIYKIIPHSSVDTRFTFPVPIPSSHQFLTELDLNDRFIHFSAAEQIPTTLNLFFKEDPAVTLLRVEVARISAWKKVGWVLPDQTPRTGDMPYLCAHAWPVPLEGEYVESFKELFRQSANGEKSAQGAWDGSLAEKEIKDWLI